MTSAQFLLPGFVFFQGVFHFGESAYFSFEENCITVAKIVQLKMVIARHVRP